MTTATKAWARTREDIESDIRHALGLVPRFLRAIPDELLEAEWQLFQRLELSETLIPLKYKQLIGLALHAGTKCRYCTLFHTEMARLFGASEEEIQEAVHYAKNSLGWSAYLNGMREDEPGFATDLRQAVEFARRGARGRA